MIYLKQVKLLDPDLVAGDPEELKYPYKAPAVRFTESFFFRKPVTFLVGENGAGKSTIMKMICGEQSPTSGHIDLPNHIKIGYLPQIM